MTHEVNLQIRPFLYTYEKTKLETFACLLHKILQSYNYNFPMYVLAISCNFEVSKLSFLSISTSSLSRNM